MIPIPMANTIPTPPISCPRAIAPAVEVTVASELPPGPSPPVVLVIDSVVTALVIVEPSVVKVLWIVDGTTTTVPEPESAAVSLLVVVTFPTVWVVSVRSLVMEPSTTAVVITIPLVVKTSVVVSSMSVAVPLSTEDLTTVLVTSSLFVNVTVSEPVVGRTETEDGEGSGQLAAANMSMLVGHLA